MGGVYVVVVLAAITKLFSSSDDSLGKRKGWGVNIFIDNLGWYSHT